MKRKQYSKVATLLGIALLIFPEQSEGTSLIVIRTRDHVILASDDRVTDIRGQIEDKQINKISFSAVSSVVIGITGTATTPRCDLVDVARRIADGNKFADQADLHYMAQKWAEFTRGCFATEVRNHAPEVARILVERAKANQGLYTDAIFVGVGKNGDILISASSAMIKMDPKGNLKPIVKEVIDIPVDGLGVTVIPRAYAIQTKARIEKEVPKNKEHLAILAGFGSRDESVQVCAAARLTAVAGEWYPQSVGGETKVAVLDRKGIRWPKIPDNCRKSHPSTSSTPTTPPK